MIHNTGRSFIPVFFISLAICLLLILFSINGVLGFVENIFLQNSFPIGFFLSSSVHAKTAEDEIFKLKKENQDLRNKLVDLKILQDDNRALRDQFQNVAILSNSLLPAKVVGAPEVIPHLTLPENLIIDKGEKEGVRKGMAIILNNNLVGIVTTTNPYFSKVTLITNVSTNLAIKDINTGALGILKGLGQGQMNIDNVTLSDTLNKDDNIVTTGSQNISGVGIPPNLIIGKIVSIDKNPSSLFQKAKLQSLVTLDNFSIFFVILR